MNSNLDAKKLAQQQLDRDCQRCAQRPEVLGTKIQRMRASPFAFLRGAAGLFYQLLGMYPELAEGPEGQGWLCGDLHLENFGVFRADASAGDQHDLTDSRLVFDLNDFDEAVEGPLRFDILRLLTSLLLAARELRIDGKNALSLCGQLLDSYNATLWRGKEQPPLPKVVGALLDKAGKRTRKDLLAARTELHHGERRLLRGDHYLNLSPELIKQIPAALGRYRDSLDESERPSADAIKLLDAAFRIAGTGSLGGLRIAALVSGKGGEDGCWIFDLKEQGTPAAAALCQSTLAPVERVLTAMKAMLSCPLPHMGKTRLLELPMLVRRLQPQEDKLDLSQIPADELPSLAVYLGALAGKAHRRGAKAPMPASPEKAEWSEAQREALLDHAADLAGYHESVYLWYCRLPIPDKTSPSSAGNAT